LEEAATATTAFQPAEPGQVTRRQAGKGNPGQLDEVDIEHHHHEQEQHRDGADIDNHQQHREEFRPDQDEKAR
jgi:hypothetical protein